MIFVIALKIENSTVEFYLFEFGVVNTFLRKFYNFILYVFLYIHKYKNRYLTINCTQENFKFRVVLSVLVTKFRQGYLDMLIFKRMTKGKFKCNMCILFTKEFGSL